MLMDSTVATLPNETALVARAMAEPVAFATIYDHYFPRVYNYVRYRVREAQAAGDVTALVFEAAWRGLGSYHPERAPFAAWLFAIARNTVNSHLRAKRRRRWLALEVLRDRVGGEPLPEQVVIQQETRAALLEALARLSERERDLIALRFAAGLTHRHIAQLVDLSESNVAVILYRAVQRLRASLGGKE